MGKALGSRPGIPDKADSKLSASPSNTLTAELTGMFGGEEGTDIPERTPLINSPTGLTAGVAGDTLGTLESTTDETAGFSRAESKPLTMSFAMLGTEAVGTSTEGAVNDGMFSCATSETIDPAAGNDSVGRTGERPVKGVTTGLTTPSTMLAMPLTALGTLF